MRPEPLSGHPVLLITSLVLMLLSFIITPPTGEMIVSLEWNGIAMLIVMTLSTAGLRKEGVLNTLARPLDAFQRIGSMAVFFASAAFILSPFISGFIASAAIVTVASEALRKRERKELIPSFAAIITLAATGGSTLLPAGSINGMLLHKALGETSFIRSMLPLFLVSVPVIAASLAVILRRRLAERVYIQQPYEEGEYNKGMRMLYVCFALIATITSLGLFRWVDILIFTIVILILFDRSVFLKADYSLLLSVIFLSIAGSCIYPAISGFLESGFLWKGIAASEIIGSHAVASMLSSTASSGDALLTATAIGSSGMLSSLPAIEAIRLMEKDERPAFLKRYIPAALVLLAAFIATALACR